MKKLLYSLIALAAIVTFASCEKEANLPENQVPEETGENNEAEGVFVPLELSYELYDFEKEQPETKSAMAGAYAKEIPSNINYYLFRNGSLVKQQYISDITKFGVQLPDKTASYNLYLLANVEQQTIAANTSEASLGSALNVDLGSQASFIQKCQTYGFPMAKKIEGFSASSSRAITLERLVHILHVKMDISELAEDYFNEFEFTKLEVRNAAKDIFPFAAASKANGRLEKGDYAISPEDLAKINSGDDVVLYVLENMRGNVFSTCSYWKDRTPANISPNPEKDKATFIEFSARVKTATADYDNITYRCYLGNTVADCNVQRNVVSTVTNAFLMDMISSEEWRVEPDEPDVKGVLKFVDSISDPEDVEEIYAMKGFSSVYYIYQNNPGIDFTISADIPSNSSPYVSFETARINEHYTAIKFRTDLPVNTSEHYDHIGNDFVGSPEVNFTLRSTDGLLSDNICCKVLNKSIGVHFNYSYSSGCVWMQASHPLPLNFYVWYNGTLNASVSYQPNGTAWSWETKTKTINIQNTAGAYSSQTLVSFKDISYTRIDQYRYINGTVRSSIGFVEYFNECNDIYGWDSYTWLNGSNGYWKYGHPELLDLQVFLLYEFRNGKYNFIPDPDTTLPVFLDNAPKRYVNIDSNPYYNRYTGSGTDWYFAWTDRQGVYYFYNTYTTPIVSGSYYGANGGDVQEDGGGNKSQVMPVHVSVNNLDNTQYYNIKWPYIDIQPVGWYVDVPEWQ